MKNAVILMFLATLLFSCSKDDELDSESSNSEEVYLTSQIDKDSIIPLNPKDFPSVKKNNLQASQASTFSNLYELEGLEFYLQSKNSYLGNNTLQTNGKGQEVELTSYSSSNQAQLFYLQFLPASSGIPYLIYSFKEQTPIGAGSYSSDPDNYVLYTQQSGASSLFGFSWDFYLNPDENGYIIENQDLIGSGSGGPFDIFYYALESRNGNIDFVKRSNNSIYQQFNIIPNDEFNIESVTLNINDATITQSVPYVVKEGTVVNNSTNNVQQTLSFSETQTETASFKETNGITTTKTGSVSLGISIPDVVEIGGSYEFQQGQSQIVEYSNSTTSSIVVADSFNIIVPPNTTVSYQFRAIRHQALVGYTAELYGVNSQNTINITGVFSGVDYSSTYLEVTENPNGGSGGVSSSKSKTYKVYSKSDAI